jgi:hypothetical protein
LHSQAWTGVIGSRSCRKPGVELDAARTRTPVNEAAKKLYYAKAKDALRAGTAYEASVWPWPGVGGRFLVT